MTLVVDASVVVAVLVDSGTHGAWAAEVLRGQSLAAPHHMPIEAANVLRRASLNADLSSDSASMAHVDLLDLRVEMFPYRPLATRCWELRENLTIYDAVYVALAEELDAPLATLDTRLAGSSGPRCEFITPE